jgi:hypothetical protein
VHEREPVRGNVERQLGHTVNEAGTDSQHIEQSTISAVVVELAAALELDAIDVEIGSAGVGTVNVGAVELRGERQNEHASK